MNRSEQSNSGATHVPSVRLTTHSVARQDQFEAWRDMTSSLVEVEPVGSPEAGFLGSLEMVDLGELQLVLFEIGTTIFNRTPRHAKGSWLDHWALMTILSGTGTFRTEGAEKETQTGTVLLQPLAAPFRGATQRLDAACVFFSRDEYWQIAADLDRAALQPIPGAMSQILRDFTASLASHARGLTTADVPSINQAFASLLSAAMKPTAETLHQARQPIAAAQFEAARRHINANLRSPDLGADSLCAHLGISRRRLYYLFEHRGGVARFIKNRRLAACHSALTHSDDKKLISSVAFDHGFTSLSSFYRQFHQRYGFSPGEARSAWQQRCAAPSAGVTSFGEWMAGYAES